MSGEAGVYQRRVMARWPLLWQRQLVVPMLSPADVANAAALLPRTVRKPRLLGKPFVSNGPTCLAG